MCHGGETLFSVILIKITFVRTCLLFINKVAQCNGYTNGNSVALVQLDNVCWEDNTVWLKMLHNATVYEQ